MQSVTWNNNDDSQFLFFPSASLGDIYLYNIENNSMKKLYAIDNTEFTPSNSIIKYEQNHITVIDTNTSKTYSFDLKISKDDELTIRDYFPNKTMTKKFSGGFENSGYTNTIYKIEGDKVQINKTNTGGAFVSIYQISNDDIRLIFTSEVPDEELQKDYIKTFKPERDDDGRVILKLPLKVGTHWTDNRGVKYEITGVNVKVETPNSTFSTIEVTSLNGDLETKTYFAKNLGIVKKVINIHMTEDLLNFE